MNPETLERLIIDASVGALSADAKALLAAYLAADPKAAALARQFEDAAHLARQSLNHGPVALPPPFSAERFLRTYRRLRWMTGLRTGLGLAASLAFGLGLGAVFFRGQGRLPSAGIEAGVQVAQAVPDRSEPRPSVTASDFWSTERLRKEALVEQRKGTPRLIWDSPVARPRLGGST